MRARSTLRTRLLVAFVAVAFVVLAVSSVTTYVLVRSSAEDSALDDLRGKSAELEQASNDVPAGLDRLAAVRQRGTPDEQRKIASGLRTRLAQIRGALELTDTRLLFVAKDGTVLTVDELGRLGKFLLGESESETQLFSLPEGLADSDLQPDHLLAGEEVSGTAGSTIFLARPVGKLRPAVGGGATIVVLGTDVVDTAVITRARPWFFVAALAALLVSVALSFWLARRLTKPVAEIQRTARVLASGDLSARANVRQGTDDELATLAQSLNAMAEQLEQARGTERAFLMSISHDLRTPLTSIRGYAEALADGTIADDDPPGRMRAASVIGSEARRLERLVRDLLDLSRLDSRQFSLHRRSCDIQQVVRDAADAFVPAARDHGLTLSTLSGPRLQADIDPERLAQIVANLVENALKYAAALVTVAVNPAPGDAFELTVTDDGPGIPDAELANVFDRLYQVRGTPGRSVGTGLGLAIVQELAHAMGGSARVERADDQGARFAVTLPLRAAGAAS